MIPTLPNPRYLDSRTPTITVAKLNWPVPRLKGHCLEMAEEAIRYSLPKARRFILLALAGDPRCMATLDAELLAWFYGLVYWSIKQAHGSLSRDEFADMDISITEIINALPTAWRQCGIDVPHEFPEEIDMSNGDPPNVAMSGVKGQLYQPGDSSVIYLADPGSGAISNRDTGTSGVLTDHVPAMLRMGCVLGRGRISKTPARYHRRSEESRLFG